MKKNFYFVVIFTCVACNNQITETNKIAAVSGSQLVRLSYQSTATDLERDFYVFLPQGYEDDEKEWPAILFLHGNGERGNGKDELDFVLVHGPVYEAWIQKRDLPFIIISPQLPMWGMDEVSYIKNRKKEDIPQRLETGVPARSDKFASNAPMTGNPSNTDFPVGPEGLPAGYQDMEIDLLTIIGMVQSKFRTDDSRLYLSGLSYGGFGTWYLASKHPEIFAAINPIVGWGHPDLMDPIAKHKIPVWVFAGGRDGVVGVEYFYPGMNKLEELGHSIRFTTEEDMNHDVWNRVYAGDDIYHWLLQHRIEPESK